MNSDAIGSNNEVPGSIEIKVHRLADYHPADESLEAHREALLKIGSAEFEFDGEIAELRVALGDAEVAGDDAEIARVEDGLIAAEKFRGRLKSYAGGLERKIRELDIRTSHSLNLAAERADEQLLIAKSTACSEWLLNDYPKLADTIARGMAELEEFAALRLRVYRDQERRRKILSADEMMEAIPDLTVLHVGTITQEMASPERQRHFRHCVSLPRAYPRDAERPSDGPVWPAAPKPKPTRSKEELDAAAAEEWRQVLDLPRSSTGAYFLQRGMHIDGDGSYGDRGRFPSG